MIGFSQALRHAQLDQATAEIDAGGAGGIIDIYDGVRPLNGVASANNILCSFTMASPSFAVANADTIIGGAIADSLGLAAAGIGAVATWFRVSDSAGTFVIDGDVGLVASGAEMEMPTTTISENLTVSIASFTISSSNLGLV